METARSDRGPSFARAPDQILRGGFSLQLSPCGLADHSAVSASSRPVVLVVCDAAGNSSDLADILAGAGLEVVWAEGDRGISPQILSTPVDLVLLDMEMPSSFGFEIFRQLKSSPRFADVPILFASAVVDTGARLAGFAAGAVDHISKPFEPDEIRARVKVHLELRQLRRDLEDRERFHRSAETQLEQAVAQAMLVIDSGGQIIFCTQSARELLTLHLPAFDPETTLLPDLVWDELFPPALNRPKLHARRMTGQASSACGNGLTVLLLEEDAPDPSQVLSHALKLTKSEANVLYWVREGKTSPEIAIILGAALTTVKKHLEHVFEKLGVETRTAAALLASEVLQHRTAS